METNHATSLSELMTSPTRVIEPDDPLSTVEQVLRSEHSRHWPVAHEQKLLGLISLRDLLTAQQPETGEERTRRLHPLRAAHVMLRARVVACPDDPASHGAALMLRHRLSCLPLVEGTRLVGVVTLDAFVQLATELLRSGRAGEIGTPVSALMTPAPVATVELLQELEIAEARMQLFHVRHLPVTRLDRVVGMFSDRDLLEAYRQFGDSARDMLVGEVMSTSPFTADPDGDAIDAAHTLMERHVGALPVTRDRELVGILSKSDFLPCVRAAG